MLFRRALCHSEIVVKCKDHGIDCYRVALYLETVVVARTARMLSDDSHRLFGYWARRTRVRFRKCRNSDPQQPADRGKIWLCQLVATFGRSGNGRIADMLPQPFERPAVLLVVDPDQVLHVCLRGDCILIQCC